MTVQEFRDLLTLHVDYAVLVKLSKRPGYHAVTAAAQLTTTRTPIWGTLALPASMVVLGVSPQLTKNVNSIVPLESGEFPNLTGVKNTTELLTLLPDTYNSSTLGISCPGLLGVVKDPYRYSPMIESTGKQALVFQFVI